MAALQFQSATTVHHWAGLGDGRYMNQHLLQVIADETKDRIRTCTLLIIDEINCRRQAHLCILANNCDEPMYVKLVEALCAEHGINLLKVDDNKKLGEWAGLCKIDKEGKARKVVGCSCVVVKDYGKESQALDVLNDYFRSKK
ncbi:small ribosomal subunit protein eS12-like [Saccostrea cucullata]